MRKNHKEVIGLVIFWFFFPKVLKYIHGSEAGAGHETEESLFEGLSLFLIDHLAFSHLSVPALFQPRGEFSLGHFQFNSIWVSVTRGQDSGKEGNEFICNLRARSTVSLPIQNKLRGRKQRLRVNCQ